MNTIAARLTGSTTAAIGTIAIRGPDAHALVAKCFGNLNAKVSQWEVNQVRFGPWRAQDPGLPPEHIVLCYTGNDTFELHLHGGMAICNRVLSDLAESGCKVIHGNDWPSEFTDPISMAGERLLIEASTSKVARLILHQMSGTLASAIDAISNKVAIGDHAQALTLLNGLIDRGKRVMKLLSPPRITLGGPPNAGKSSLTNALFGTRRVLVHEEAGTTRDAIEVPIVVHGWPVVLTDTAGIREATDEIESKGVALATANWFEADLGILVVDGLVGWTSTHDRMIADREGETWVAWNKVDLLDNFSIQEIQSTLPKRIRGRTNLHVVPTCAGATPQVDGLLTDVGQWLENHVEDPSVATPFCESQVDGLMASREAIQHGDVASSLVALSRLVEPRAPVRS